MKRSQRKSVPLCREPFIFEDETKQRKKLVSMCRERFIPEHVFIDDPEDESSSEDESDESDEESEFDEESESDEESEDSSERKSSGRFSLDNYPEYTLDNLEEGIITPIGKKYSMVPKNHPIMEPFNLKNLKNSTVKLVLGFYKVLTKDVLELIELIRSEAKKKLKDDFYDDKLLPWSMNEKTTVEFNNCCDGGHRALKNDPDDGDENKSAWSKHCPPSHPLFGLYDQAKEKHQQITLANRGEEILPTCKKRGQRSAIADLDEEIRSSMHDTSNLVKNTPPVTPLDTSENFLSKQPGEDNLSQTNECVVCMENLKNTLLLPCAHACVCTDCSDSIDQCPLCRTDVEKRMKIFI